MVLENVCPPALLYLAFSVIQIIIDLYRGDSVQAMFKFIVMIIFTIVLNAICKAGMSIVSWFIVFIPFILMTYITTILFFVFGINTGKVSPRTRDKNCNDTMFGCCDDGVTAKTDPSGRNCAYNPVIMPVSTYMNIPVSVYNPIPWNNKDGHHYYPRHNDRRRRGFPIGGCAGTQYGCCDDRTTARTNPYGSNCPGYITNPVTVSSNTNNTPIPAPTPTPPTPTPTPPTPTPTPPAPIPPATPITPMPATQPSSFISRVESYF